MNGSTTERFRAGSVIVMVIQMVLVTNSSDSTRNGSNTSGNSESARNGHSYSSIGSNCSNGNSSHSHR